MNSNIFMSRILVIDDLFGRTHKDRRNRDRESLCGLYLLNDITGDEEGKGTSTLKIKRPVAEAVFYRGQNPVSSNVGDTVENDLKGTLKVISEGWTKPPYWSLVLLDLCFYTGKVTDKSNSKTLGMPEGRPGDNDPKKYFGLRILEAITENFPGLPVVILSSQPREEVSREFSIRGARAFIPRADEKGPELLSEYLNKYGLLPDEEGEIIGYSKSLLTALNSIRRTAFAGDRRNLLIRGERGTGKELIARYIHRQRTKAKVDILSGNEDAEPWIVLGRRSKGKSSPFVVVDSSTLTDDLFESELFGIEPNVATGVDGRSGLIKEADGGELFFDEIKDMPSQVQAGVLRVLQEKVIRPVGAKKYIPVDASFISATNINIEALSAIGNFRSDLLDRLRGGGTIFLPPLRERIEDIPLLVERFVRIAEKSILKAKHRKVDDNALDKLMRYDWPGNIRDLENCIKNAVTFNPDLEHLVPSHINFPGDDRIEAQRQVSVPIQLERKIQETILPSVDRMEPSVPGAFIEKKLPVLLADQNKQTVSYIVQALEAKRDVGNDEPNYPQTWKAMTGDSKKRNSSEYQRFIGNYIFQLSDDEIADFMKHSKVFEKAVIQCGSKVQSAKKRLAEIVNKKES